LRDGECAVLLASVGVERAEVAADDHAADDHRVLVLLT
jgi:hypothetical protein